MVASATSEILDLRFLPLLIAALWPTFIGCTPADDDDSAVAADDDDSGPAMGTLALSFRLDPDWAEGMDEPAVGAFYGSIFLSSQVSGIGPEDDAVNLGSADVKLVDLTGEDLSTGVLVVTEPLPAEWVVVLGFLDSDGNSVEDDRDPDENDPVTLPNDNQFLVVEGEETEAEVFFGFLNP